MQTQDRKPHLGGTVISLLLIVLVGIVMWGLLSAKGSTSSVQNRAAKKAASVATLSIMLTTSPFPTFPPTPTPYALGIVSDEETRALGYLLGLVAQNAWVGVINGTAIVVWAGAPVDTPDEGAILVRWTVHGQILLQRVVLPGKHGAAKITADQNNRLTLASADKTTFYYDVPGLSLVNSLTESVPTVDFSAMATATAGAPASTPVPTAYP